MKTQNCLLFLQKHLVTSAVNGSILVPMRGLTSVHFNGPISTQTPPDQSEVLLLPIRLFVQRKLRYSFEPGRGSECRKYSCSLLSRSWCTHIHTSGNKCHNSGPPSVSHGCPPLCIPPQLLRAGYEACKRIGAPWVSLLKTTHRQEKTRRYCRKSLSGKIVLFFKKSKNCYLGCTQSSYCKEKMVVIGCQAVLNAAK